jgi:hypothetical protein
MRAGVDRKCHVIYNVSPDTSWEVYRIDRDPLETEDLAGDGDECAATRRAVEKWYDASTATGGADILTQRPAIAAPLDADFLGARLLSVELPAQKKAGDTITVTWTWEARSPIAPGWKVFAHLDGPAFVNADHMPGLPFEAWKPGQFIRYTTQIVMPRVAGHYTLSAGLWNGKARAQGHVKGAAADAVTLPVEVTP